MSVPQPADETTERLARLEAEVACLQRLVFMEQERARPAPADLKAARRQARQERMAALRWEEAG